MDLPPMIRLLLWPLSVAYGAAVRLRASLYAKGIFRQQRLRTPVISVGNLTVGGTGKTPMVIWLAERFLAGGQRVGILSRGYRGSNGTSDEIELMKKHLRGRVLFGVGPDRCEQGRRLEEQGVDVLLLDDGFQHLQLARNANILLLDSSRSLGKEWLLPAGRLREPVSAMSRADALVFTRTDATPGTSAAIGKLEDYPVFAASTSLLGFRRLDDAGPLLGAAQLASTPCYAFCGIGNPGAFFRDLANWKVPLAGSCAFADHHRYDARDLREIQASARKAGAQALITTEKDAENLPVQPASELPVYAAIIDLAISREDAFLELIRERIAAAVRP